jgi:hypothetical protein
MARRRRRHRRGFGDLVSVPSLSGLKVPKLRDLNPLGKSVNSTDLVFGAAVAMGGGVLVKMGLNKLNEVIGGKFPAFILNYIGPISTLLAGIVAGQILQKGRKFNAYYTGAVLAAGVPFAWQTLRDFAPAYFSDYVSIPGMGLMVDEGYAGLMVDDPGMADLAAYSTNDEEDILSAA